MTERDNNAPFYGWVPRPVGIAILMLMFVPPTFSGGAYLSNINEMGGSLGLWSEDIQLASFFTSIGMCLFPPFMVRFLQARKIRETYLWCFAALIPLNLECAVTDSLPLLLGLCLLTGFARVIVMLNCTFTIAPYLTGMNTLDMFTMTSEPPPGIQYGLERKRTFLMPVLYFYILLLSQLSNILTAWFAYHYDWRDAYTVTAGMCAAAMVLVLCTMPGERRRFNYRPEPGMVADMLLMATALCAMAYTLTYGRAMDWYASPRIRTATGISVVSAAIFLWRLATRREHYYLPRGIFSFRNVRMAMLLFLVTMIFNSANVFVGVFSRLSTRADNLLNAGLAWWAIAGCGLGLLLSLIMVGRRFRFRTTFCIAFLFMASANAYLYFQYTTEGVFEHMSVPTLLNFTGLLMLYSLVAAFGMKGLPSRFLATFVFLMIWMRNAIAPVAGTSIYSNLLEHRQRYYISGLSRDITAERQEASLTHDRALTLAARSGRGPYEAEQSATASPSARVAVQATILAMKDITGQTVILLVVTSGAVLVLPYRKGETT